MPTTLHIKNMVCPRCIRTVSETLGGLGLSVKRVQLGEAEVGENDIPLPEIDQALQTQGFELVQEKEEQTVARIKATLIDYLAMLETNKQPVNLSAYLSERLYASYPHLSKTFSRAENTTIEKYFILLKIERVKELLSYQELTLSEIAFRLHYSSVQALSNQFKKVTGLSVSDFRHEGSAARKSLDAL
jgi:AraC family transcriptional regulator